MNESKTRPDSPMWAKWKASGAIGTMGSVRLNSERTKFNSFEFHALRYSPATVLDESISPDTGMALLREIATLARKGYEVEDYGFRVKTLPRLYGDNGELQEGKVSITCQTKDGQTKSPGSSYATAVLHGSAEPREILHVVDPEAASPWLMKLPLATEAFGQKILEEIRVNSAR